jgi:hypothetical protein
VSRCEGGVAVCVVERCVQGGGGVFVGWNARAGRGSGCVGLEKAQISLKKG